MSRNVPRNFRKKSAVTPTKGSSRKSSRATNDSSDDDYAGVDLISDSEEDEPDVEGAEEQAIIDSEEDDADDEDLQNTPRPSQDDLSSWNGFDPESEEDIGLQNQFFDDQFGRTPTPAYFHDDEEASPTRRVRFDLSDSNDPESEDELDGLFPDIFLPQERLDPGFRRLIERDDDQNSSGNESSYWDHNNSDDQATPQQANEDDSDSDDESTDSSGYDSEGDTTDEDLPPAARYAPAKTVLRRPSEEESEAEEEVPRHGPTRLRYPKLSQWVHDPTKPFAIIDTTTKKLLLFKALKRRYSTNDILVTPRVGHDIDSPGPIFSADVTPMISNSANLMMSAMSTPYDNLFQGQAIGPSEAFFPFTSISADGTIFPNIDDYELDEDDFSSPEDLLDITNWVDMGDYSDMEDTEAEDPFSDSQLTAAEGSSVRPTTATSEDQVHPLLNHFDSGVVGAFRKNQNRHQLLSRNTESAASLAFHGPNRPVRGIKGGRLQAANAPITPLRKQKFSRPMVGPADSSPLAHLTGGGIEDKKRKFDMVEAARGHKRTKSLM